MTCFVSSGTLNFNSIKLLCCTGLDIVTYFAVRRPTDRQMSTTLF